MLLAKNLCIWYWNSIKYVGKLSAETFASIHQQIEAEVPTQTANFKSYRSLSSPVIH
jgi:hypothetical protein